MIESLQLLKVILYPFFDNIITKFLLQQLIICFINGYCMRDKEKEMAYIFDPRDTNWLDSG